MSPSERRRPTLDKVGEYLDAGSRLVWVIDPRARQATAWDASGRVTTLSAGDQLDGGSVLPGFRYPLGELLEV